MLQLVQSSLRRAVRHRCDGMEPTRSLVSSRVRYGGSQARELHRRDCGECPVAMSAPDQDSSTACGPRTATYEVELQSGVQGKEHAVLATLNRTQAELSSTLKKMFKVDDHTVSYTHLTLPTNREV